MGVRSLWEHLIKAYEQPPLPHFHRISANQIVDPPHLHKLDCGYTKPTPQHTHRLYKHHMRCKKWHCQAMQDHIAITSKPSTIEELYTCAKENIASGKRALYSIRLTYDRKLVYVYL